MKLENETTKKEETMKTLSHEFYTKRNGCFGSRWVLADGDGVLWTATSKTGMLRNLRTSGISHKVTVAELTDTSKQWTMAFA